MPERLLTANRLADGIVVYLDAAGGWTPRIAEARRARGAADEPALIEAGRRAADAAEIVEPYLIDVAGDGPAVRPVKLREAIRATGPTVQQALNRNPAEA